MLSTVFGGTFRSGAVRTQHEQNTARLSSVFLDDLSTMFDTLDDVINSDRLVVCGDFNCGGNNSISVSIDLQTVFDTHGLRQSVQSPTRRTNDVSNLLDLVIGRDGSRL